MQIAIGSDHAGFSLKEHLLSQIRGHVLVDHGTFSSASVDYPDYARLVADAVVAGNADLGIVICGSGNGVAMVANKKKGVRAALAWHPEVASLARQHNNANVLALPARFIDETAAMQIVKAFLAAHFEGGRHARRVDGIELSQ
jgi:ribose 5-phosphate isomerase B